MIRHRLGLWSLSQSRMLRRLLLVLMLTSCVLTTSTGFLMSALKKAKEITVNGVKAVGSLVKKGFCYNVECCSDRWTSHNLTGLEKALEESVFGQHIVVKSLVRLLRAHRNNPSPPKALVLSLHGGTGTGKNFVSRIIAQHLYRKGQDSSYYHTYISTHHFPHEGDVNSYKKELRKEIWKRVNACKRSLFVFDEMDKLPKGLVDVLTPFVDHHPMVDGVNFRHAVFIFLSNLGGKQINEITFRHWEKGRERTDLQVRDFDPVLLVNSYNEDGGFWHSAMIVKNVIDFHVPFLPLERSHVKKCAAAELQKRNITMFTDAQLTEVADEMQYFPKEHQLYSKSGCKKVVSKIDLLFGHH